MPKRSGYQAATSPDPSEIPPSGGSSVSRPGGDLARDLAIDPVQVHVHLPAETLAYLAEQLEAIKCELRDIARSLRQSSEEPLGLHPLIPTATTTADLARRKSKKDNP
jgi:hypothetical protein